MASGREVSVVTVGEKGSYLSSASVYAVANGLAQVRIDSSVLDKLSAHHSLSSIPLQISNPRFLTLEESRASLVVLLNKIVLSNTAVRPALAVLISETLNRGFGPETIDFGSVSRFLDSVLRFNGTTLEETGVTDGELVVMENWSSTLDGISALLDCSSSALSTVADAVAALSCEALKADVSVALNLLDSGDGFSVKDEIAVAGDMKVLLVGSKLVGHVVSDAVSEIPKFHGSFREVVRLVHSRIQVELNSVVKGGKAGLGSAVGSWKGKVLVTTLLPLATSLLFLGESSLRRAKLTVDSICNVDLRSRVLETFEMSCPSTYSLREGCRLISQAAFGVGYVNFLHELYGLLVKVRAVIAWEGALALLSLEENELNEETQGVASSRVEANAGNTNVEQKSEKTEKVMGKGTAVIRQLIKDRLQSEGVDPLNNLAHLDEWARDLSLYFDPKDPELDTLLKKVKEILESNEVRRLPTLPKAPISFEPPSVIESSEVLEVPISFEPPSVIESSEVLDFTGTFTTDEVFHSRDELFKWVQDVGKTVGTVVVVARSDNQKGKTPRLTFGCERGGKEKGSRKRAESKKPSRRSGTKKCGCPFSLRGVKLPVGDQWMVKVICGTHNHPIAQHFKGRSYAGRLTPTERQILIDMSVAGVKAKEVLRTIKEKDRKNASTMRTIYNARSKMRRRESGEKSQMQVLSPNES